MFEIRFSEPNWYKDICKSALVMPLFLYGIPDIYLSSSKQRLVNWLQNCAATSSNTNCYHETLSSLVSATVSSSDANLYYHDTGNTILKAMVQHVKKFLPY
jgi:hypothetical protein